MSKIDFIKLNQKDKVGAVQEGMFDNSVAITLSRCNKWKMKKIENELNEYLYSETNLDEVTIVYGNTIYPKIKKSKTFDVKKMKYVKLRSVYPRGTNLNDPKLYFPIPQLYLYKGAAAPWNCYF